MFSDETEILRKIRLIEHLKAELVTDVGQVYHAVAENNGQAVHALADVIIGGYVLGKRLGIEYVALDEAVNRKVEMLINQEPDPEKWYGDYSALRHHIQRKG